MPEEDWELLGSEFVADERVFRLHHDRYRLKCADAEQDFVRLEAPDWVIVVPLTPDERVIMVRQFRHGVAASSIEIPGGMIDPGEAPEVAAARELEEETGYRARSLEPLGTTWPNPALMDNSCHFFVARDVECVGPPRTDAMEMLEVFDVGLDEIPRMLARGDVGHSLMVVAFAYLGVVAHRAGTAGE